MSERLQVTGLALFLLWLCIVGWLALAALLVAN